MVRKKVDRNGIHPMDTNYLTEIQMAYYKYIRWHISTYDVSPSIQEIADHFGVNGSTANRMVDRLHANGAIFRPIGLRRSIKVLQLRNQETRSSEGKMTGNSSKRKLSDYGIIREE